MIEYFLPVKVRRHKWSSFRGTRFLYGTSSFFFEEHQLCNKLWPDCQVAAASKPRGNVQHGFRNIHCMYNAHNNRAWSTYRCGWWKHSVIGLQWRSHWPMSALQSHLSRVYLMFTLRSSFHSQPQPLPLPLPLSLYLCSILHEAAAL